MKCDAMLLAAAVILLGLGSVQAGEFIVINSSNEEVVVSTLYFRPGGTADSIAFDQWPNAWMHEGWWVVKPGGRATVYSGNQGKIYVRMTKSGNVIKPDKSYSVTRAPIVRGVRFRLERVDPNGPYNLQSGPQLQTRRSGKSAQEVGMEYVDGFYQMDSNTNFTVR